MTEGNGLPIRPTDEVDRQLSELAGPLVHLRDQEEAKLASLEGERDKALASLRAQEAETRTRFRARSAASREKISRINKTLHTLEPDMRPTRQSKPLGGSRSTQPYKNPPEDRLAEARSFLATVEETTGPDLEAALGWNKGQGLRILETLRVEEEVRLAGRRHREGVNKGAKSRIYRPLNSLLTDEPELVGAEA